MLAWSIGDRPVQKYSSYKNEQFNKKLAKAKSLIDSIESTSLKKEDKALLKAKIKEML